MASSYFYGMILLQVGLFKNIVGVLFHKVVTASAVLVIAIWHRQKTMNLRPRNVNFDDVWGTLKNTVEGIVKLQPLKRITWDHNFRLAFLFHLLFLMNICQFSDIYFLCVSIPEAQSQRLYFALQECLKSHTKQVFKVNSLNFFHFVNFFMIKFSICILYRRTNY